MRYDEGPGHNPFFSRSLRQRFPLSYNKPPLIMEASASRFFRLLHLRPNVKLGVLAVLEWSQTTLRMTESSNVALRLLGTNNAVAETPWAFQDSMRSRQVLPQGSIDVCREPYNFSHPYIAPLSLSEIIFAVLTFSFAFVLLVTFESLTLSRLAKHGRRKVCACGQ